MNPSFDRQIRLMHFASNPDAFLASAENVAYDPDIPMGPSAHSGDRLSRTRRARTIALIAKLLDTLKLDLVEPAPQSTHGNFEFGTIVIDPRMRQVKRDGEHIDLSPREYDLLLALALAEGAPLARETIAASVWRESLSPDSRTIDQHIGQIRKKLEREPANPSFILTVPKFGYRLTGSWSARGEMAG